MVALILPCDGTQELPVVASVVSDAAVYAGADAAGITPAVLNALVDELCGRQMGGFAGLMATHPSYHPTMRVDIDPRFGQLAVAFNAAASSMGQQRSAWTPAYSDADREVLVRWGLLKGGANG